MPYYPQWILSVSLNSSWILSALCGSYPESESGRRFFFKFQHYITACKCKNRFWGPYSLVDHCDSGTVLWCGAVFDSQIHHDTCVFKSAGLLLQAKHERYDDDDDQRGSMYLYLQWSLWCPAIFPSIDVEAHACMCAGGHATCSCWLDEWETL